MTRPNRSGLFQMCIRDRTGTADSALTFTTAVGMVVGVHHRTADCRADAHVALTSGFTKIHQRVLAIAAVSYTHLDVYKRQALRYADYHVVD